MLATSIQLGRMIDFIVVNNESTNVKNTVVTNFSFKFCWYLISSARIRFETHKNTTTENFNLHFLWNVRTKFFYTSSKDSFFT